MNINMFEQLIKYYKNNKEDDNIYSTRVKCENNDTFRVIKSINDMDYDLKIKNLGDFVRLLIAAKNITLPYIKNIYNDFINSPQIIEYLEQNTLLSRLINELEDYDVLYNHDNTPLEQDFKNVDKLYKNLDLNRIMEIYNKLDEAILKHTHITLEYITSLFNKDFVNKYQNQLLSLTNILKRHHGFMHDYKKEKIGKNEISIYDEIQNPLDNSETLKKILDLYINGRVDAGSKPIENKYDFYKRVADYGCENKKNQDEYRYGFYKYIKIPNLEKLYRNFREIDNESSKYNIIYNSFKTYSDIEKVYYEQKLDYIEDILKLEIFSESKQEIMHKLQQLNLTERQIENRKILIEFRRSLINSFYGGEGVMGFHVNPQVLHEHDAKEKKIKGEMKFYINAGVDTYRFASLFQEKCESLHLNYYFKVVNADDKGEYKRNDKMCIYTEIKDAKTFLSILKDLRAKNPDIKFEDPPFLSGIIDTFIGVGMDTKGSSYNQQMSEICFNSIEKIFGEIPREKIFETLQIHPELIDNLKQEILSAAKNFGLSEEKICIDKDVAQKLKQNNKEAQTVGERE